jgi:hypothetical protein
METKINSDKIYKSKILKFFEDLSNEKLQLEINYPEDLYENEEFKYYIKNKEHYITSCAYMFFKEHNHGKLFLEALKEYMSKTNILYNYGYILFYRHIEFMEECIEHQWNKCPHISKEKNKISKSDLVNYFYYTIFYSNQKDFTNSQFIHDLLAKTKNTLFEFLQNYI